MTQAPRMAPRPVKGRTIKIVCPMCETPGYIAPSMQGRDVKCANPECIVPVFKVPIPERKVDQPEVSPGLFSTRTLWYGLLVGVPLVGLIVWMMLPESDRRRPDVTNVPPPPKQQSSAVEQEPAEPVAESSSTRPRLTMAQIQPLALEEADKAARDRDRNRSKPYCRRLAAEAYAQAGDLVEARHQLERLQVVSSEQFYRVKPLVEIAWQQLAKGDRAAAEKTIDEAMASAQQFPPFGRAAVSAVISLASALAAVDRLDDAKVVVGRLNREDDSALARDRVAALVQVSGDLNLFDLDRLLKYSSLDLASNPVSIAVTTSTAARGYWPQAIAWAMSAEAPVVREDSLAAAAVVAGNQPPDEDHSPVDQIRKAAQKLSVAGQCRVAAGIATGNLLRGDRTAAAEALQEAQALLEKIPRPAAVPKPDVKTIYGSVNRPGDGLQDRDPLRSAAIGAAQIARLQMLLDDSDQGWQTFLKAWEFSAGMGPQLDATSRLADEITASQPKAEARLRQELQLSNRDLVDRAFNQYRRQARIWGEAAQERFQVETALLREAVQWGWLDQVADVVRRPSEIIPTAVGQPYGSSPVAASLADAYTAAGMTDKAQEMTTQAGESASSTDPIAAVASQAERLVKAGKYAEAAKALAGVHARETTLQQRDLIALQLACRALKSKQPAAYFGFIRELGNSVLKEDCYELTGALAVLENVAPELWERLPREDLSSTERAAFCRGLIAGIAARPQSLPGAAKSAQADTPQSSH